MLLMSWLSYFEKVLGMGLNLPAKIVWAKPYMSSALNGTSKVVISYMTQPKDQISDLES